jgi:nucleotide-binding universal stress UspA family protein
MFSRILVAVDPDELVDAVIREAGDLAEALGSRLAFVHIIDPAAALTPLAAADNAGGLGLPTLGGSGSAALTEQVIEEQREEGESFVDQLPARLPAGVRAEVLLREGAPAAGIIDAAREWDADLIIAGTHGRGGLQRLFVGSTAEAVLRSAPCPVLVIRGKGARAE